MKNRLKKILLIMILSAPEILLAHHVLGRPSYSLNENSNTPPSMQVETRIGSYFVTYMAFPAFPKPNEQGRVSVYIRHIKDGKPFTGEVSFVVKDNSWFGGNKDEVLGSQKPIDNVYRQGFLFKSEGNFIISARFQAGGEPYIIDLPVRIGNPWPVGPLGIIIGAFVLLLLGVNIAVRRRLGRMKAKRHHEELTT